MTNSRFSLVAVVLFLVVMSSAAPVAAATTPDGSSSVEARFTETVEVEQGDNSTYLWQSEPNSLEVSFHATNETNIYKVCILDEAGERLECQDKNAGPGNQTVTFEYDNLTAFAETRTISVVVYNNFPGENEELGRDTLNITTIKKSGDIDGDNLQNGDEVGNETYMLISDTDQDSLPDGAEVKNYNTSPIDADTDYDGIPDAAELSNSLDPNNPDTDGDGIPDGVEVEQGLAPKDPTADTDGDGLTDAYEYTHDSSPTKADTDGDGLNDKLEAQLGTDPRDSSTTPMILTAIGTLLGVTVVGTRWFLTSSHSRYDVAPLSWLSSTRPRPEVETRDDGTTETVDLSQPPEFDENELQNSSAPVLTDEDKVVKVLRDNGGWVYQSQIVESTNWSKSKVSRLLSRMCEDETIEKISVGRQNIVAEQGSMPDAFGSPFDE